MLDQLIPNQYIRALIVLVASLVLMRVALTFAFMVLKHATKKTKTDIDDKLIRRSRNPITLLFFFISIRISLNQLLIQDNVMMSLERINDTLIIISLAYILYLILEIVIFRALTSFLKRTGTEVDSGIMEVIKNALRIALIVFAILYILENWGVEIGPFLAGLGIAGLAIALALQPTLSNIFSGIAMILDKSVRVGDLVYLDPTTKGIIQHIGFRSTKIKTYDNEMIIIPNNKLSDSKIQNVALPEPSSRVVIPFSVVYGSDVAKIKKIVLKEVKSVKKVCKIPEPIVRFAEMGPTAINMKVYFYVKHYNDRFDCIDEANTKIYDALIKNKVEFKK